MVNRSRVYALLTTLLAVLGVALAGTPAQASNAVQISILNSTSCLDNAADNAGKLIMWGCHGGLNQKWILFGASDSSRVELINENTDRCITAPPGAGSVVMKVCDRSDLTQQWDIIPTNTPPGEPFAVFDLIKSPSGLCLWTSTGANGTVPSMAGCEPPITSRNERWVLS